MKKLTLNKQTIRNLTPSALRHLVGGAPRFDIYSYPVCSSDAVACFKDSDDYTCNDQGTCFYCTGVTNGGCP